MKIRRSVLKDTVTVRTRTGEGSYGDVLADPVTVSCLVDETRRMVRSSDGQETLSESTLLLHPRTRVTAEDDSVSEVDPLTLFTPESEILLADRTSRVITAKPLKLRGYVTGVQVACT